LLVARLLLSAASEGRNQTGFEQKTAKEAKGGAARRKTSGFVSFAVFCSKSYQENKNLPDSSTSVNSLVLLSCNFLFSGEDLQPQKGTKITKAPAL
jgi:hypothetical protein